MDVHQRKEIARAARLHIASEARWCKEAPARTARNFPTLPDTEHAAKWDLSGSLIFVTRQPIEELEPLVQDLRALGMKALKLPESDTRMTLGDVNDWLGHAGVIRILDTYLSDSI